MTVTQWSINYLIDAHKTEPKIYDKIKMKRNTKCKYTKHYVRTTEDESTIIILKRITSTEWVSGKQNWSNLIKLKKELQKKRRIIINKNNNNNNSSSSWKKAEKSK